MAMLAQLSKLSEGVTLESDDEKMLRKNLHDKRRKLAPTEDEDACGMLTVTKPITSHRAPAPFRNSSEHAVVMESILRDLTSHSLKVKLLLEYVEVDDIRRFRSDLRANKDAYEVQMYWRCIENRQEIANLKAVTSMRMTLEFPLDGNEEPNGMDTGTEDTHLVMVYDVPVTRRVPPPPELLFPTDEQVSPPLPRFFVEFWFSY